MEDLQLFRGPPEEANDDTEVLDIGENNIR